MRHSKLDYKTLGLADFHRGFPTRRPQVSESFSVIASTEPLELEAHDRCHDDFSLES